MSPAARSYEGFETNVHDAYEPNVNITRRFPAHEHFITASRRPGELDRKFRKTTFRFSV